MRRLFDLAWLLLMLGMAIAYPWLPEQVGDPGKEASRPVFAGLMVFVAMNALLCSHHFILWIGRRAPGLINLPHKAYWFAPERFEDSLQRLATHLSALGLQVIVLTAGLYAWPVLDAHWGPLPAAWGWAGAGLLLICFGLWVVAQFRQFPAPPPSSDTPPPRGPRRPDKSRAHGQP